MTKNSIKDRIKITKRGKIRRRAMALSHSRVGKRRVQILNKKKERGLNVSKHIIKKNVLGA